MDGILVNSRPLGPRDWALDVAVAVVVFSLGLAQLSLANSAFVVRDEEFRTLIGVVNVAPAASAYVLLILTTWPLVLRRKFTWPVFVFTFTAYAVALTRMSAYTLAIFGPMVSLFTVAYERPRFEGVLATLVCIAVIAFIEMPFGLNESLVLLSRIQNGAYLAVAAASGIAFGLYRDYLRASAEREQAAYAQREEEAARRVEEERLAIAREIHDITAHSLTAVSIQAAAAEKMIDRSPEAAREVIVQVRDTSKGALEEIRSMISVLRNEGQEPETAPTQGTDRLDDLVDYAEEAGLQVKLEYDGYCKDEVPAYVDVALYGIAREAVTNTVRHANAQQVRIVLSLDAGRANLLVEDDGQGAAKMREGSHGLQGMEERVRVLGGIFAAQNRPQGGFAVTASIPLEERE